MVSKIKFFVADIFQVNQFENNQTGLVFYKNNFVLSKFALFKTFLILSLLLKLFVQKSGTLPKRSLTWERAAYIKTSYALKIIELSCNAAEWCGAVFERVT